MTTTTPPPAGDDLPDDPSVDPDDAGRYGVVQTGGGRVREYAYKPDDPAGNLICNEVFVFAPGRVLGYVGDSGNAKGTPPHLHYGVYQAGGAINPFPLLRAQPPADAAAGAAGVGVDHHLLAGAAQDGGAAGQAHRCEHEHVPHHDSPLLPP